MMLVDPSYETRVIEKLTIENERLAAFKADVLRVAWTVEREAQPPRLLVHASFELGTWVARADYDEAKRREALAIGALHALIAEATR